MVSMLADWSSLAGLVVGIIGFGFSIWLLVKTRKASELVRAEIERTLALLGTRLLSDEIANADLLANDLRLMCQNQRRELAADRCATLRKCLIHINENSRIAQSVLEERQFSMDDIRLLLVELERKQRDSDSRPVSDRKWTLVQQVTDWIHVLATRIANDALETRTYERESS